MRRHSHAPDGSAPLDRQPAHVSRALSEARLAQGISMGSLARTLGCSYAQLERMETGRANLTVGALLEWVLALNLDLVVQPRRGWPASEALTADGPEGRLVEAYRAADGRTRDAVAVLLGLERPLSPPVRLTRAGRPRGPAAATTSLRLNLTQLDQLRRSPVPFTGNRVITALKLADGTITQLAHEARLRYSRVTRIVNGKLREVPAAYAAELADCFGCVAQDLFPSTALYPAGAETGTERGAGTEAAAASA